MDDIAILKPGDEVVRDGKRMRYLGNGVLVPVEDDTLAKRFGPEDGEPLHKPFDGGGAL